MLTRLLTHVIWLLALVCLVPMGLFSQPQFPPQKLPSGWVTGSQVPDSAAYHLVLLSLRPAGNQSDMPRYLAKWKKLGLSAIDTKTAQQIVAEFDTQYSAWRTTQQSVPNTQGAIPTSPVAIVQQAMNALSGQLTPEGGAKFSQFIQAAKARMAVRP